MPTATVNGVDLTYDRAGSGAPVILVCGLAVPRITWIMQTTELCEHFDVVWFDNRGVSESGAVVADFELREMASDVVGLMDHCGFESAHVVAISMGGMIGQELAIEFPDRVRSLTLISTMAGGATQVLPSMEVLNSFGFDGDPNERAKNLIDAVFGEEFRTTQPTLLGMVSEFFLQRQSGEEAAGQLGQMLAIGRWSNEGGTADRLEQIITPTLVLHGESDELVPCGNGKIVADGIRDAKLITFPNAGHALNFERADDVNKLTVSHVREVEESR